MVNEKYATFLIQEDVLQQNFSIHPTTTTIIMIKTKTARAIPAV